MSIINDTSAQMEFRERPVDIAPLGSVISSDHSDGKSSPRLPSSTATSVAAESIPDIAQDPSVITGLAFRLPGAKTLSQLWDNVVSQKDLQQKIPSDRFNVDAFYNPQGVNKGTVSDTYFAFSHSLLRLIGHRQMPGMATSLKSHSTSSTMSSFASPDRRLNQWILNRDFFLRLSTKPWKMVSYCMSLKRL
jgi:hypothetical protein